MLLLMLRVRDIALASALLVLAACSSNNAGTANQKALNPIEDPSTGGTLFSELTPDQTGIGFENTITEDDNINFYRYQYLYNGGGVAIGDLNNDGLPDAYFTGNMVPDKLFRNNGNLQFEDVSTQAGIDVPTGWKTGVNMVDINCDGLLDIYVARSGWYEDAAIRKNLLFINQGDFEFEEQAEAYGLADAGHSVHSAFFDYDGDGDLDCYVTNHPVAFNQTAGERAQQMQSPGYEVRDRLYRKDTNRFTDVSKEAGIWNYGHGLGLAVADLNMDNRPDIYVANDFQSPDFYYVNNGDGTFTDKLKDMVAHTSYFAMGMDVADINNDLLPDFFVVEMLAADNKRQKTNMAPMNPGLFWDMVDRGLHYQYMRNSLQVNNGNGTFSEIGWQAGLTNTDWSWGPLLADFDNDGDRDLVVTNGYLHDTQDKDFVNKAKELIKKKNGALPLYSELQPYLKSTRVANFAFRNDGDYTFSDVSQEWDFNFAGFSNGVAYGDLDGDGDLDLLVNNINDGALLYRNNAADTKPNKSLSVKLKGPAQNPFGLGAKLTLTTNKGQQYQEFQVVRGFQGTVNYEAHFGMAEGDVAKLLFVQWPDKRTQEIRLQADTRTLTLNHADASEGMQLKPKAKKLFAQLGSAQQGAIFTHVEQPYDDYATEILLPHKQSQYGPRIAVGDINNDGSEDFFICGAAGQAGKLFSFGAQMQLNTVSSATFEAHAAFEDVNALFFDADDDGDQDLYVVSGSNEFAEGSEQLIDRLYVNNNGTFAYLPNALPADMRTFGAVARAADFDADGDLDLFVGGHVVPGKYPVPPRSYILQNNNGRFADVTESVCAELLEPGMVNDALWSDFNQDGKPDLIIVGEWMPISFYENTGGSLQNVTEALGLASSTGWWWRIVEGDFDSDGKPDYVAGNLGLNYKYQTSDAEPFQVYCHDFDQSGTFDIVLGYYNDGTCFPVRGRQCSSDQMPFIKKKFPTYEAFGEATIEQVYGEELDNALHYQAYNFQSCVVRPTDAGFETVPLPPQAQFAPAMGLIPGDFTGDGQHDLLLAGNLYVSEVETGRADAGIGMLLTGNGNGSFEPMPVSESGFFAPGDVRDIKLVNVPQVGALVLVARNNGAVTIYKSKAAPILN